jgi:hypothetical protein
MQPISGRSISVISCGAGWLLADGITLDNDIQTAFNATLNGFHFYICSFRDCHVEDLGLKHNMKGAS